MVHISLVVEAYSKADGSLASSRGDGCESSHLSSPGEPNAGSSFTLGVETLQQEVGDWLVREHPEMGLS
jgi:hypothetical protein